MSVTAVKYSVHQIGSYAINCVDTELEEGFSEVKVILKKLYYRKDVISNLMSK